ncbi:MAG: enolase C-terminal domain-like protein [Solirubrobacterales bacterium]
MDVERFELFALRLALKRPFETAAGRVAERRVAVLRLTDRAGNAGLGEVTPYPRPGAGGLRDLVEALNQHARPRLESRAIEEPARIPREFGELLPPPALAAVDSALSDLHARQLAIPLAESLNRHARKSVEVNATIASSDIDDAVAQARAAVAAGYSTIKLKVGLPGDEARVAAVRDAIGWNRRLRLDANGAWFSAEAIAEIGRLAQFGLELVEQPVAAEDLMGMHRVRDAVSVPVVADEGIRTDADLQAHIANAACDGVAVKLSEAGGLTRAAALLERVSSAGLFCFVTSALDGPVGIAAALHFVASRSDIELACGLATADALADSYATGLPVAAGGRIAISPSPGLGIELDEDAIAEFSIELGPGD